LNSNNIFLFENSIGELVKRDQNGIIFQDANDLCDRLQV